MIRIPNKITINLINFSFMANSKSIVCEINKKESGKRLDQALTSLTRNLSRSQIKLLLVKGNIKKSNIEFKDVSYKVKEGDKFEILLPLKKNYSKFIPQNIPIDIVYEDKDIIVLNKESGIVTHPAPGNENGTIVNALLFYTNNKLSRFGDSTRPGIVHRLDKETSGLLVVAKNNLAHNVLAKQFKDHSINRKYLALVWGFPKLKIIKGYIARHKIHRKKMTLVENKKGKYSETQIKINKKFKLCSLIECELKTGRTHQVRVHLNSIGNPLVGDKIYGKNKTNSSFKIKDNYNKFLLIKNFNRQALHAYVLGFKHPKTQKYIEFKSDLPQDFSNLLNYLSKY